MKKLLFLLSGYMALSSNAVELKFHDFESNTVGDTFEMKQICGDEGNATATVTEGHDNTANNYAFTETPTLTLADFAGNTLEAWARDHAAGIEEINMEEEPELSPYVDVYDITGRLEKHQLERGQINSLDPGLYIIDRKKIMIR